MRKINQMCVMWFMLCELWHSKAPGWWLPLHAGSLAYCFQWWCVLLGIIAKTYNCIEWVYVCVRECVWHSAWRYRPLVVKIAFHVPHFSIISWYSYLSLSFLSTINVTKLLLCKKCSITRWWCYGAPITGTVGCFAHVHAIYFLIQSEHIQ